MPLPIDLVFVRHGESEGNVAVHASRDGDHSLYTEEFLARPSYLWRLTEHGVEQAEAAGAWIRENIATHWDRAHVSEYIRAKETALHLGLHGPKPDFWYPDMNIREQEWGDADVLSELERDRRYPGLMEQRKKNRWYWRPPNGESLADVSNRLTMSLNTVARDIPDGRCIFTCHGEVMLCGVAKMERRRAAGFAGRAHQEIERIDNCEVIWYTRRDPETKLVQPHHGWVCRAVPWKGDGVVWQPVERAGLSNDDLRAEVDLYPRILGSSSC